MICCHDAWAPLPDFHKELNEFEGGRDAYIVALSRLLKRADINKVASCVTKLFAVMTTEDEVRAALVSVVFTMKASVDSGYSTYTTALLNAGVVAAMCRHCRRCPQHTELCLWALVPLVSSESTGVHPVLLRLKETLLPFRHMERGTWRKLDEQIRLYTQRYNSRCADFNAYLLVEEEERTKLKLAAAEEKRLRNVASRRAGNQRAKEAATATRVAKKASRDAAVEASKAATSHTVSVRLATRAPSPTREAKHRRLPVFEALTWET